MSLNVSQSLLQQSTRELTLKWQNTRDRWDDDVRRQFQERYLEPIEPKVRAALSAMNDMQDLVQQARRQCGD